jgi:endonuclease YncB( thermonuclease family)
MLRKPYPAVAVALIGLLCSDGATAFGDEQPLWTDTPVHIDPSKQHYQRLPADTPAGRPRDWLVVPHNVRIIDSATFVIDKHVYHLGQVAALKLDRLCHDADGGRWPCGREAAIFLGNLIRGRRLLCPTDPLSKEVDANTCMVGTNAIAFEIIKNGYARALPGSGLEEAQSLAQRAGEGIWRNPACLADFDHC